MQKYVRIKDGKTEVEAIQLTKDSVDEVELWCGGQFIVMTNPETGDKVVGMNLLGPVGMVRAVQGDYVIKFREAFYVGKPHRFETTYKPAP